MMLRQRIDGINKEHFGLACYQLASVGANLILDIFQLQIRGNLANILLQACYCILLINIKVHSWQ